MRVWLQGITRGAFKVLKGVVLMAGVVLMITTAKEYVVRASSEGSTEPPPVQPLEIQYELHDFNCETDGKVIHAIADVRVSGGEPPYRYEMDPGELLYAEFQLPESGIRFRIEGGQTVILEVRSGTSNGEPKITRDISAPAYLVDCEARVHTPTPTPGTTSTPVPGSTDTPTLTPTPTPTRPSTSGATATRDLDDPETTGTPAVNPTATRGSTPTGGPTSTDKPPSTEKPTSTSPPPPPTSTRPPRPSPTSPPPPPTSTPPPPPPNEAECQDGRDNDGDGYTDMQDPQCRSRNDNHEDK